MAKERAASGYDLGCSVSDGVAFMLRQAMIGHTLRKGCKWKNDALATATQLPSAQALIEDIKKLPSFQQLGVDLEPLEAECAEVA